MSTRRQFIQALPATGASFAVSGHLVLNESPAHAQEAAPSDVKVAEGKAPRKPPLTREGRNALAEIGAKIGLISWQLTQLTEPALKGLAFEVRRTAEYGDEPGLWLGQPLIDPPVAGGALIEVLEFF